jgi:hypothetical protein
VTPNADDWTSTRLRAICPLNNRIGRADEPAQQFRSQGSQGPCFRPPPDDELPDGDPLVGWLPLVDGMKPLDDSLLDEELLLDEGLLDGADSLIDEPLVLKRDSLVDDGLVRPESDSLADETSLLDAGPLPDSLADVDWLHDDWLSQLDELPLCDDALPADADALWEKEVLLDPEPSTERESLIDPDWLPEDPPPPDDVSLDEPPLCEETALDETPV